MWGTGAGPALNHLCKVLLGVVSRLRLWKQQLSLFLTDPRDLEGVIWKSLQLLEPLSMEGLIPREVSHVFPCDAASAPPYFPASPGIHSPKQDFGAELPGGRTTLPCATAGSWGCGATNIQANPSDLRSKQVPENICKQQNPTSFNPCPAAWSLCCTVREGQALQQGRRGQRRSWPGGMQSVTALSLLVEGLSNSLLGRKGLGARFVCGISWNPIKSPPCLISSAEHLRCCTFIYLLGCSRL